MARKVESLDRIAEQLGYQSEADMLLALYVKGGWSITELSKKIGYSKANMRIRLLRLGVKLRNRGGDNRCTTLQ